MVGIYHNKDLDGIACGAIMKKKYPGIYLIGYDYGDVLEDIEPGVPVIMADISLPMEDMELIAKQSNYQFTWVEHHISSVNAYKKYCVNGGFLNLVYKPRVAACQILWEYMYPQRLVPEPIYLLSKYDVWDNSDKNLWKSNILPFQYGMRGVCNSVSSFPAWALSRRIGANITNTINDGNAILRYEYRRNEFVCKKYTFEAMFKGYLAICLNNPIFNSGVFKSIYNPAKHDLMIVFLFDGFKYTVSIYSEDDKIDCSALAVSMGGGGHKGAAGFQALEFKDIGLGILK